MKSAFLVSILALAFLSGVAPVRSQPAARRGAGAAPVAERVKSEFLHAWHGYEQYAWGHDALDPLSLKPRDWYAKPLLMTPVDALDTLVLMGLDREAKKDRALIDAKLSFDQDMYVKVFEVNIRLLGGLLSGYEMTGDKRLLSLAEDLGTRLLPAFASPTGLPYRFVNLQTGKVRGTISNPAETGTLLLELGTLSKLTGNPVFYAKAKRALVETFKRRSPLGLVGDEINVETSKWVDPDSHISGGIDSYYEYLWKSWKLFGDKDCLAMWRASIVSINRYLADEVKGALWYGHANMLSGKRTATEYGALDAFFPAVLAFSGDLDRARRLQESSYRMWDLKGIEPEILDYRAMTVKAPGYELRPEIIESTYYLYCLTGDEKYRIRGREMFENFVKYCRARAGYAALESVITKKKRDRMESYLFAETFKYFYLLFAPSSTLDFDKVVFNTEGHPLLRRIPPSLAPAKAGHWRP